VADSMAQTPAARPRAQPHSNTTVTQTDIGKVCQWIKELCNPNTKENALNELWNGKAVLFC